jgi:hypothetical protein
MRAKIESDFEFERKFILREGSIMDMLLRIASQMLVAIRSAKKWLGGPGWNKCATGWDERGSRLQGRPFIDLHPNYGTVHVDVEYLEDSPSTEKTRDWLRGMIK